MNNVDSRASQSVRVRTAERADAEKITTVINSAFRGAEFFFVEGDRVEVERHHDLEEFLSGLIEAHHGASNGAGGSFRRWCQVALALVQFDNQRQLFTGIAGVPPATRRRRAVVAGQ